MILSHIQLLRLLSLLFCFWAHLYCICGRHSHIPQNLTVSLVYPFFPPGIGWKTVRFLLLHQTQNCCNFVPVWIVRNPLVWQPMEQFFEQNFVIIRHSPGIIFSNYSNWYVYQSHYHSYYCDHSSVTTNIMILNYQLN